MRVRNEAKFVLFCLSDPESKIKRCVFKSENYKAVFTKVIQKVPTLLQVVWGSSKGTLRHFTHPFTKMNPRKGNSINAEGRLKP